MEIEEAKKEVSEILRKVIYAEEVYYLDGKYVRWGRVEKDLHAVLDCLLTPRALDEAPRGCEHKNMLPSEPHGFLYCPDCGLRQ